MCRKMQMCLMMFARALPTFAAGCGGEEEAGPDFVDPVEPEAPDEEPMEEEVELTEEDIPIVADFEEAAEAEINEENYASVLDQIEAELGPEEE